MKHTFKFSAVKWLVVGGLLMLVSITSVGNVLAVNLTETDKESLRFMREEEKLAKDVYHVLFDMWGSSIFNNISGSEQTHMDTIKTLLDRYDIEDPASEIEGEFNNPELQVLYVELVALGSISLVEALNVGVIIEEKDIADLHDRMNPTLPKDIKTVYSNLLKGSVNHLKAFTSNLAMQGFVLEQ
ncbi:MAG: DUF2202 domain-containing protein [Deltaproteobacteria bacterium]